MRAVLRLMTWLATSLIVVTFAAYLELHLMAGLAFLLIMAAGFVLWLFAEIGRLE